MEMRRDVVKKIKRVSFIYYAAGLLLSRMTRFEYRDWEFVQFSFFLFSHPTHEPRQGLGDIFGNAP